MMLLLMKWPFKKKKYVSAPIRLYDGSAMLKFKQTDIHFFSFICLFNFKIRYIHTKHSYTTFIHHSATPIILLHIPESNSFCDLDRHGTRNRDYL
jgi:hypothetical protein